MSIHKNIEEMNSKFQQPFTFDRVVRIVIALLVVICLFFLVKKLSAVLVPFLVAWLLAYLIHPLVAFFQYKCKLKNRFLSIFIAFLFIIGGIVGLSYLVIPPIVEEINRASGIISIYDEAIRQISFLPKDLQVMVLDWLNRVSMIDFFSAENFGLSINQLAPNFLSILSESVSLILSLLVVVIVFLYTFFILADYEKITEGWIDLVPYKYKSLVSDVFNDLEEGMNRYFRGQALIALIVGILMSIGFVIIDMPLGILLGLLVGVLTLIPYMKVMALIPTSFLALLQAMETGENFWVIMLPVGIVFVTVQAIEDFVLVPKVMGKVTGMKPAVILLSLSIWGSLLGVAGMIIALPATTIILSYYKRFILVQREKDMPESISN